MWRIKDFSHICTSATHKCYTQKSLTHTRQLSPCMPMQKDLNFEIFVTDTSLSLIHSITKKNWVGCACSSLLHWTTCLLNDRIVVTVNLQSPEKKVNIDEEKGKCSILSLSLISPPSSSSLLHILSSWEEEKGSKGTSTYLEMKEDQCQETYTTLEVTGAWATKPRRRQQRVQRPSGWWGQTAKPQMGMGGLKTWLRDKAPFT